MRYKENNITLYFGLFGSQMCVRIWPKYLELEETILIKHRVISVLKSRNRPVIISLYYPILFFGGC